MGHKTHSFLLGRLWVMVSLIFFISLSACKTNNPTTGKSGGEGRDPGFEQILTTIPQKYFTFEGDGTPSFSSDYGFLNYRDSVAGYATWLSPVEDSVPRNPVPGEILVAVAQYPVVDAPDIWVVSNSKYDFVCFELPSLFLRKKETEWEIVSIGELFQIDPYSVKPYMKEEETFAIFQRGAEINYSFWVNPDVSGGGIWIELHICDYLEYSNLSEEEAGKLLNGDYLRKHFSWDGKHFVLDREETINRR